MNRMIRYCLLLSIIVTALSSCIYPGVDIVLSPFAVSVAQGDSVIVRVDSTVKDCPSNDLPCFDISNQFIDYVLKNLPAGISVSYDNSLRSVDTPGLMLVTISAAPDVTPGSYQIPVIAVINGQPLGVETLTLQVQAQSGSRSTAAIMAIAAGSNTSFAILADNSVWAWGENQSGQLGDGTRSNRAVPVLLSDISNTVSIVSSSSPAGGNHTLARLIDSTVRGWGSNWENELGTGLVPDSTSIPVPIPTLSTVQALSTHFFHSLALLADGTVMSWGENDHGQLGTGDETDQSKPVAVAGLSNVRAIATTANASLALLNDGTLRVWGKTKLFADDQLLPVAVPGLNNVAAIAGGTGHALVLLNDGTLRAWGDNSQGSLGDGTTIDRSSPVVVQGLNNIIAIAAGSRHSLALASDGRVWAWGRNLHNQLGDDDGSRSVPAAVPNLSDVVAIAAGNNHSMALLSCGTLRSWGDNLLGALGNQSFFGAAHPGPVPVLNLGDSSQCNEVALTVALTGNGSGTVISTDSLINCDQDCNSETVLVTRTRPLNLSASAESGSQFVRWDGDCSGTDTTVNIVMSADKHCIAVFEPLLEQAFLLSVAASGSGNGTISSIPVGIFGPDRIDCGAICNAVFPGGATITITATPASGSQFSGWAGDCSGSSPVTQVMMSAARQCIATFTASDFMLTVNKNGDGRVVAVQPTFSEIDCGDFCTDFYPPGTEVILIPAAESAANFAGWSGCDQVVDEGCVINMSNNRTVTATFN